jgi:hypothetical protein
MQVKVLQCCENALPGVAIPQIYTFFANKRPLRPAGENFFRASGGGMDIKKREIAVTVTSR